MLERVERKNTSTLEGAVGQIFESIKIIDGKPRIDEPFTILVNKESITAEALVKFANLPLECFIFSEPGNTIRITTGRVSDARPDYGDVNEKDWVEKYGSISVDYKGDKDLSFEANVKSKFHELGGRFKQEMTDYLFALEKASGTESVNYTSSSGYTAHQHPGGSRVPSIPDREISRKSKNTKYDLIFTKESVIIFKEDSATGINVEMEKRIAVRKAKEEGCYDRDFEFNFLLQAGVIKGEIKFTDPNFKKIVSFMKGDLLNLLI